MKIFNLNSKKNYYILAIIFIGLIAAIFNWLWFIIYTFDKTPAVAIDSIVVFNIALTFLVARRVPLASAMLLGSSFLLLLLGLALIKGFISAH